MNRKYTKRKIVNSIITIVIIVLIAAAIYIVKAVPTITGVVTEKTDEGLLIVPKEMSLENLSNDEKMISSNFLIYPSYFPEKFKKDMKTGDEVTAYYSGGVKLVIPAKIEAYWISK